MYLRLKMPFWALSGCNSRKKLLFQLYYYYGAFEALGWVLTGKFPSPASQQLFHQKLISSKCGKCEIFQPPRGGTTGALQELLNPLCDALFSQNLHF